MNWAYLKDKIYYEDGSLRDIFVLHVTISDWQAWVDLVNNKYQVEFYDARSDRRSNQLELGPIVETWTEDQREWVTASIILGRARLNCFFYGEDEIEHDIDPREFKSIEDHNLLIEYLVDVSVSLGKDIMVIEENTRESILMSVVGQQLTINA